MKKTKRKAPRLTGKATDEEIIRWTNSHDVFDRLETGVSEVVEDHNDLDEVLRESRKNVYEEYDCIRPQFPSLPRGIRQRLCLSRTRIKIPYFR